MLHGKVLTFVRTYKDFIYSKPLMMSMTTILFSNALSEVNRFEPVDKYIDNTLSEDYKGFILYKGARSLTIIIPIVKRRLLSK